MNQVQCALLMCLRFVSQLFGHVSFVYPSVGAPAQSWVKYYFTSSKFNLYLFSKLQFPVHNFYIEVAHKFDTHLLSLLFLNCMKFYAMLIICSSNQTQLNNNLSSFDQFFMITYITFILKIYCYLNYKRFKFGESTLVFEYLPAKLCLFYLVIKGKILIV